MIEEPPPPPPPRVFPRCQLTPTIAESPTADALARHSALGTLRITRRTRTRWCRLLSDLSNVFTKRLSSLSSATSLACNGSDGGNRFGLHACVFLCAGQASPISLADSCGKCQTRLPVINAPICSRLAVNFRIRLTCCELLMQAAV